MNLNDLYKKISDIPVEDFPPAALSGLLHGYLSIYSMVRVNPWLEETYGSQWSIHERIREIAGELADLINDPSVALEDRVGYVADLMETYLMYSDMDFLEIALDAAYEIIYPEGSDEIVLPCRTPEMCRLLCSYYYFTGEDECVKLAGEIAGEWRLIDVYEKDRNIRERWRSHYAIEFYENTIVKEKQFRENVMDIFKEQTLRSILENDFSENDLTMKVFCFDIMCTNECTGQIY